MTMTITDIRAAIDAVDLKAGVKVDYNRNRYGNYQVEIRDADGCLIWRAWDFESDFDHWFTQTLRNYSTPKSPADVAAAVAVRRASELRNDAITFDDLGYVLCSNFTQDEIDAEIAVMKAEQAALLEPQPRVVRFPKEKNYASRADFVAAKIEWLGYIARDLWSARRNAVYGKALRKTIASLRKYRAERDEVECQRSTVAGQPFVRVTTLAGVILVAPTADVQVLPAACRLFALWDMRHGMTRDTHYNRTVQASDIKTIEYGVW